MHKPQPEIFHLAADRLHIHPTEALFVDDSNHFIEGAQAIGMIGVQFQDTRQTIAEIQKHLGNESF